MLKLLVTITLFYGLNTNASTLTCNSVDSAAPGLGITATIENEKISKIKLNNERPLGREMNLAEDAKYSRSETHLALSATEVCEFEGGSCLRIRLTANKNTGSLFYFGQMKIFIRESFFRTRTGKISVNAECHINP